MISGTLFQRSFLRNRFTASPTEEEFKEAVYFILTDSSPEPKKFGYDFFITYWGFIKDDLLKVPTTFSME